MSTPAPGTWKPLRILGGKAQQTAGRDDFGRRLLLWMRRGGSVRCENPDKKHNYKVEPDS